MRRLLTTALLALPFAAHAWGADGHQTIGALAAGLLRGSPTEARVAALLGDIPLPLASIWADCAKGISPAQGYTYPAPGKYPACAPLETPARIAEMADYVRRNDRQCALGASEDSCHRQTHYSDVAVQRSRYLAGFAGTRPDDVVGALQAAIGVLQGRLTQGQPDFKSKREALLVLTHLVGDLHQPLHVGTVYLDARGHRADPDKVGPDRAISTAGGNHIALATPDGPRNLHSHWDAVADELRPQHVDAAWVAQARRIAADAGTPADWPTRWASQSLDEARNVLGSLSVAPRQAGKWPAQAAPDEEVRKQALQRRQLTLAGARLAQLLKALLP